MENSEILVPELKINHDSIHAMLNVLKTQEVEGTNFVIIFCSSLLECSEDLIKQGFTTQIIIEGFNKALDLSLSIFETLKFEDENRHIRNIKLTNKIYICS